ncbi:MAG: regulatory protein RecX [Melioribacteraceae bacterium]
MTITALQRKGSNVLVCFDDAAPVAMDYRTVLDNGLRKNDVLDETTLNRLISESVFLKLKDSAFRLLGRRHHSVSELRNKLAKKKMPKEIVEKVLTDFKEKKLLDDEQFALAYLEERFVRKKIGVNKLKAELFKKGIERSIVDKVLLNLDRDLSYRQAVELAEKKISSLGDKITDRKKKRFKIYSFLTSRGFESDLVLRTLNELMPDDD